MTVTVKHGIKALAESKSDVFNLRLADVHVREGWNIREYDFDPADEEDMTLARSISKIGVKELLSGTMEEGKFYLTNGHRRRAAVLYANEHLGAAIETLRVQLEDRYSDPAEHVASTIVRNGGKEPTPYAKGIAMKRLIGFGWSEERIADFTGMTRTRVVQLLDVQAAPEPVKVMVRDGAMSADLALMVVKEADGNAEKAIEVAEAAVATAKAAGKTKATAKHLPLGEVRETLKGVVKDILRESEVEEPASPESDDLVIVKLSWDLYSRLKSLV